MFPNTVRLNQFPEYMYSGVGGMGGCCNCGDGAEVETQCCNAAAAVVLRRFHKFLSIQ